MLGVTRNPLKPQSGSGRFSDLLMSQQMVKKVSVADLAGQYGLLSEIDLQTRTAGVVFFHGENHRRVYRRYALQDLVIVSTLVEISPTIRSYFSTFKELSPKALDKIRRQTNQIRGISVSTETSEVETPRQLPNPPSHPSQVSQLGKSQSNDIQGDQASPPLQLQPTSIGQGQRQVQIFHQGDARLNDSQGFPARHHQLDSTHTYVNPRSATSSVGTLHRSQMLIPSPIEISVDAVSQDIESTVLAAPAHSATSTRASTYFVTSLDPVRVISTRFGNTNGIAHAGPTPEFPGLSNYYTVRTARAQGFPHPVPVQREGRTESATAAARTQATPCPIHANPRQFRSEAIPEPLQMSGQVRPHTAAAAVGVRGVQSRNVPQRARLRRSTAAEPIRISLYAHSPRKVAAIIPVAQPVPAPPVPAPPPRAVFAINASEVFLLEPFIECRLKDAIDAGWQIKKERLEGEPEEVNGVVVRRHYEELRHPFQRKSFRDTDAAKRVLCRSVAKNAAADLQRLFRDSCATEEEETVPPFEASAVEENWLRLEKGERLAFCTTERKPFVLIPVDKGLRSYASSNSSDSSYSPDSSGCSSAGKSEQSQGGSRFLAWLRRMRLSWNGPSSFSGTELQDGDDATIYYDRIQGTQFVVDEAGHEYHVNDPIIRLHKFAGVRRPLPQPDTRLPRQFANNCPRPDFDETAENVVSTDAVRVMGDAGTGLIYLCRKLTMVAENGPFSTYTRHNQKTPNCSLRLASYVLRTFKYGNHARREASVAVSVVSKSASTSRASAATTLKASSSDVKGDVSSTSIWQGNCSSSSFTFSTSDSSTSTTTLSNSSTFNDSSESTLLHFFGRSSDTVGTSSSI